jgi:hypothetical protein
MKQGLFQQLLMQLCLNINDQNLNVAAFIFPRLRKPDRLRKTCQVLPGLSGSTGNSNYAFESYKKPSTIVFLLTSMRPTTPV